MKINSDELSKYYNLAKKATPQQIKSLNQTERKVVKTILVTLKNGGLEADSRAINDKTLDSITTKLTVSELAKPSSLINRIIKGALNILGLRTSSREIIREISFLNKYGSKETFEKIQEDRLATRQILKELQSNKKLDEETSKILRLDKDLINIKDGHLDQFIADYTRGGIVAVVTDSQRGNFQGKKREKECEQNDNLHFNFEGLSKVFQRGNETKWMHLAEACLTQTPLNAIGFPLRTGMTQKDGELITVKIGENDFVKRAEPGEQLVNVTVVRDKQGEIQKLEINATLDAEIAFTPDFDAESEEKISIGNVRSHINFTVSYAEDGTTPVINNLKRRYIFSEIPFTQEETPEPGFHPTKSEPALPQRTDAGKLIQQWDEELSKLKLSIKPTKSKIEILENRISNLESARKNIKGASSIEKDRMDIIINNFTTYRDLLIAKGPFA